MESGKYLYCSGNKCNQIIKVSEETFSYHESSVKNYYCIECKSTKKQVE
jgi:hypothetical protein